MSSAVDKVWSRGTGGGGVDKERKLLQIAELASVKSVTCVGDGTNKLDAWADGSMGMLRTGVHVEARSFAPLQRLRQVGDV